MTKAQNFKYLFGDLDSIKTCSAGLKPCPVNLPQAALEDHTTCGLDSAKKLKLAELFRPGFLTQGHAAKVSYENLLQSTCGGRPS